MNEKKINNIFIDSISVIENSKSLSKEIEMIVETIINSLKNGKKIITFGNGGSAADAQHFAAELVGRFKKERKSLPAIALTTDTSIVTAIGNDYSFDKIFSRQCESLVDKDDTIIAISTSGNSKNVIDGIISGREKGAKIIGLTGRDGGRLKELADLCVKAPSDSTPRIQEVHRIVLHIICELIDDYFSVKTQNV